MGAADDFLAQAGGGASQTAAPTLANQFVAQAQQPQEAGSSQGNFFTRGWTDPKEWAHQLGLTARAAVTGVTAIPAIVGNGVNGAINMGIDGVNAVSGSNIGHLRMPTEMIQQAEDAVMPAPRNAQERIVQDAASSVAGLFPTMAAGKAMATAASPVAQAIGRTITAVPGNQAVAAASGGASAGGAREAGLGAGWQLGAGVAGGMLGAVGAAGLGAAASKTKGLFVSPDTKPELAPSAVEAALNYSAAFPASAERQQTLTQRTAALLDNAPGADPASAARDADAKALGLQLTLGQKTRDPGLYAQEQNWRGTAAGAPLLQRFSQLNGRLAAALDGAVGSGAEPYADGKQIIGTLQNIDSSMKGQVSAAYRAAEQSAGAKFDVPLEGVAQDYASVLHNFGDKVPSGVRNNFESLGLLTGNQKKVFGVDDAENLLKVINANHSNDPASNAALTQLSQSVKRAVLSADDQGGVFAAPRQLAAQRFALHDNVPALADSVKGNIAPEDFTRKYLMNGDVDHVKGLADLLGQAHPQALDLVRGQVGNEIKRAAFGENTAGDKVFTPERFSRALRNFGGTEKLNALYGPDTTDDIYNIGRVGSYINSEPAFSPVNRSNTGSAVVDMLSEVPMIGRAANALGKKAMIARALAGELSKTGTPAADPTTLGASMMLNARPTPANVRDQ